MFVFNSLMNLTDEQGNIGPYAEQIDTVREAGSIEVPVSGYPNAGVTLYEPAGRSGSLPLIVYIHGGGWCTGKASAVRSFAKLLASNGCIVANLDYGAPVTTSRMDVDYIVTEYGVAHLKGHSLRERAKSLIAIAHPDFRAELQDEFARRFIPSA